MTFLKDVKSCFNPTDSELSFCNCQNIHECFFHDEIIRFVLADVTLGKGTKYVNFCLDIIKI